MKLRFPCSCIGTSETAQQNRSVSTGIDTRTKSEVVLKVDLPNNKCRQKVMETASGLSGVDSVSMDQDQNLTLTGVIDPEEVVRKLSKLCRAEIVSVGPCRSVWQQPQPCYYASNVAEGPTECVIC